MYSKSLALAALASTVTAQSLTELLTNTSSLSNLTSYLQGFPNLVTQLSSASNITILAPNNEAFAAFLNSSVAGALASDTSLIQGVLTYHVLNGTHSNITNTTFIPTNLQPPQYTNVTGGQRVAAMSGENGTEFISGLLTKSNTVGDAVNFTGGVVHIIDRLLSIPANASTTLLNLNLTAAVGALRALNLTETLDTTEDVTLFIPTNEAFASIASVLNTTNTTLLTEVLSYHAVIGSVLYSTDIMNGSSVQTVAGTNITARIEDGDVYINNAKVTVPNVLIANGVVHVIDEVLNPGNTTLEDNPSSTSAAFPGATSASDIPFTSGVVAPTSVVATSNAPGASSSSSSAAGARETGALGVAALFGGAAVLMAM